VEFVAIDFETTAYETDGAVEPWQLGVAIVRDFEIVDTAEFFFKSSPLETWDDWYPLIGSRRLAAHNIATERTILNRIAPLTRWGPWTDTMKLAKARYPRQASYALGDLCTAFGCVPEMPGRTWHDGLFDAVACARLAIFLNIM
jgi:DNA polymerase III epsilon subunit-like protein